jgi:hypothetical protein
VFFDEGKSHLLLSAKNTVAFFNTSLLSYELVSSCANLEPLPGTSIMAGSGGGRIGSLLIVMDR